MEKCQEKKYLFNRCKLLEKNITHRLQLLLVKSGVESTRAFLFSSSTDIKQHKKLEGTSFSIFQTCVRDKLLFGDVLSLIFYIVLENSLYLNQTS